MTTSTETAGHAFISYVREDAGRVEDIVSALKAADIPVWTDKFKLSPGQDWQLTIRNAIQRNALAFIAVFSNNSRARDKSYQHKELNLAVEQLLQHPPGRVWLIPVRLDDCELPEYELGAGRTFDSLQRADLFGNDAKNEMIRLITAVLRVLGDGVAAGPQRASITQLDHSPPSARSSAEIDPMPVEPPRRVEVSDVVPAATNPPRNESATAQPFPGGASLGADAGFSRQLGTHQEAAQVESAIEIVNASGVPAVWSFELKIDAPLDPEALRAVLVATFVDDASDPSDFDLSYAGTFAKPRFKLSARRNGFIADTRSQDRYS